MNKPMGAGEIESRAGMPERRKGLRYSEVMKSTVDGVPTLSIKSGSSELSAQLVESSDSRLIFRVSEFKDNTSGVEQRSTMLFEMLKRLMDDPEAAGVTSLEFPMDDANLGDKLLSMEHAEVLFDMDRATLLATKERLFGRSAKPGQQEPIRIFVERYRKLMEELESPATE